jgi:hypothetical protein
MEKRYVDKSREEGEPRRGPRRVREGRVDLSLLVAGLVSFTLEEESLGQILVCCHT